MNKMCVWPIRSHALSHSVLTTILQSKCHCPHFSGEETEAQRGRDWPKVIEAAGSCNSNGWVLCAYHGVVTVSVVVLP